MVAINLVRRQRGTRRGSWFYHINDGFHYHKNCTKRMKVYLKCVHYEVGCHGRAMYSRATGFIHTNNHDVCIRDRYFPLVRLLRQRILMRCRRLEVISLRQLLNEESARFPLQVQMRVRLSHMRSAMQRARLGVFPPPPQTLQELTDILQNPQYRVLSATSDGADNLYASSVTAADGSHHIIFISQRMARVLKRLAILFGDGTFKVLPAMHGLGRASQVFSLVGNWDHVVIPLGWILMESRTEDAYCAVFGVLRNLIGQFVNLELFISDFEAATHNAVARVFPGISLQGCFFHLVRAMIRYAKEVLGMARLLRLHPYERLVKLCCALALLPLNMIVRGFTLIIQEAMVQGLRVYRLMRPFFDYVCRRWVGHPVRRQWMCVFGSLHRTNNTCESHNRVLKNTVGRQHPNVYQFIIALVSLETSTAADVGAMRRGDRPNRMRTARSIALDRRLRNLANGLQHPVDNQDDAIMRYLEAAVHTFDRAYDRAVDEV